jgi:23S rRNA (cytosine1962-C5)-methyltransferase
MSLPRVILQPRRARPFHARHPWVFAGAISRVEGEPPDGAEVDLLTSTGQFVARGLYNSHSKIRVRLFSWSPDVSLDHDFFRERLSAAIALRRDVLRLDGPGRACRLVFSEGDWLPGLVVDRYDRWLVMQLTSLGLAQRREMLAEILVDLLRPKGIYLRTEKGIGRLEGLELQDGPLWGTTPATPIEVEEEGLRFLVHLTEGQKTGYYLDQRDNRRAAAQLASGRRVLDAFCYSGGFGLHAARAGATAVVAIDSSHTALELARANARKNGFDNFTFIEDDVFEQLAAFLAAGERFGVVVLDPPKFARTHDGVEDALRGYRRLQALGLRLLEPDGILVTCCCSGLISADMLAEVIAELAAEESRDVQVLEARGQAPDHPVAATCPESNYLKCLICRAR